MPWITNTPTRSLPRTYYLTTMSSSGNHKNILKLFKVPGRSTRFYEKKIILHGYGVDSMIKRLDDLDTP